MKIVFCESQKTVGVGEEGVVTFDAAKMVACKWLWVLAGQVGASCQFEQVWCCIYA